MRISDWSSDVCSSDLDPQIGNVGGDRAVGRAVGRSERDTDILRVQELERALIDRAERGDVEAAATAAQAEVCFGADLDVGQPFLVGGLVWPVDRKRVV